MNKLTNLQAHDYWKNLHREKKEDLSIVCFPNRSRGFNLFYDRIEKFAIGRGLKYTQMLLNDKVVLDLGCGRGRWLKYYQQKGAMVTGIDLSEEAVLSCAAKGFTAVKGDITAMPFPDNVFDVINSVAVIQHLPYEKQKETAAEIQRVCKQNGLIVLLENTWNDPAPHVWGRPVRDWVTLFNRSELIYLEGHNYVYLFRLLWRFPFLNYYPFFSRMMETITTHLSYPLEYGLMLLYRNRPNKHSMQHIMIFRKK